MKRLLKVKHFVVEYVPLLLGLTTLVYFFWIWPIAKIPEPWLFPFAWIGGLGMAIFIFRRQRRAFKKWRERGR